MKRDRLIYKVLTKGQWNQFQRDGVFKGSPVDFADGYIHLSCASQLKVTLDKYYADQTDVTILQVDAMKISADLKYEVSRGGDEFPHLFADLPMTAIGQLWLVSPENEAYTLPSDLHPN